MEQVVEKVVRRKRQFTGLVTSVSGQKSIVVEVRRRVLHRVYRKYLLKRASYMAHDEKSACSAGDQVRIEECRPLSARKRWRVVQLVQKSAGVA
jgi:small subunit ribosomal protein S17